MNEAKIGFRELAALGIMMVSPKLANDTPGYFFKQVGTAGWIVPFIAGLISFIPIFLLLTIMKRYEDKNLLDVIYHLFGQKLGKLLIFFLWLSASIFIIFDSAVHAKLIGTMYYVNSPSLIIYLLFVGTCAFGTYKGIQSISNVAWLLLPFLLVVVLASFILAMRQGQTSFLFPIFGYGAEKIFKTSITHVGVYADFFFLFVFSTIVTSKKVFKRAILSSVTLVIIGVTVSTITFLMVFDYESIHLVSFPYHELIRFISIGSLTNIEALYFPFWLIASFIRYALYFYLCSFTLANLLNIRDYRYLIPIIVTLFTFIGSIPDFPSFVLVNNKHVNTHIFSILFIIFSIAMWIRFIYIRRFRHCSKNTS